MKLFRIMRACAFFSLFSFVLETAVWAEYTPGNESGESEAAAPRLVPPQRIEERAGLFVAAGIRAHICNICLQIDTIEEEMRALETVSGECRPAESEDERKNSLLVLDQKWAVLMEKYSKGQDQLSMAEMFLSVYRDDLRKIRAQDEALMKEGVRTLWDDFCQIVINW